MSFESGVMPYRKLPGWLGLLERNRLNRLSLTATWEPGRQGTGYEKFDIMSEVGAHLIVRRALKTLGNPSRYDAWLLNYPVGSEIPPHFDDEEEGMCHVRLNALVIAGVGGVLKLRGQEQSLDVGDAYIFRPDLTRHSVTPIQETPRLVLSVGANVEYDHAQKLGLV